MPQYSRGTNKSYHSARSSLKIGKDGINRDDMLITLLERENLLSKYKIDKAVIKASIDKIESDHISMGDVIDLLKKWNISKTDEDILVGELSEHSRKKNIKK